MKYRYKKSLKPLARGLRKQMTKGEVLLWKRLRARQMMEYRFYRQYPMGDYILDFYCRRLNLAIEVDGRSHNDPERYERDLKKDKFLEEQGIKVLRFTESDVCSDIEAVLFAIEGCSRERTLPLNPLPEGRGL